MDRAIPLHAVAEAGSLERVRELLDAGAAIDAQDHNGLTPLMLAIYHGNEDVALELVARGARLDVVDKGGRNALEWARESCPAALHAMQERGAAASVTEHLDTPYDEPGFSPAHAAFLASLRAGRRFRVAGTPEVLGAIRDDMPADLKALLHTWAHRPSQLVAVGGWWLVPAALSADHAAAPAGLDPARVCFLGDDCGDGRLLATWSDPAGPTELWSMLRGEAPERCGQLGDLPPPRSRSASERPEAGRQPIPGGALALTPIEYTEVPANRDPREVAYWAAPEASLEHGGGWVARNHHRAGYLRAVEVVAAVLDPTATVHAVELPSTVEKAPGVCAFHPRQPFALLACRDLHLVDVPSGARRAVAPGPPGGFLGAAFVADHHVAAASDAALVLLRRGAGDAPLEEVARLSFDVAPARNQPPRRPLFTRDDGRALVFWGVTPAGTTKVWLLRVERDELVIAGEVSAPARHAVLRAGSQLVLAPREASASWWRLDVAG